jgi:hypothetical protein
MRDQCFGGTDEGFPRIYVVNSYLRGLAPLAADTGHVKIVLEIVARATLIKFFMWQRQLDSKALCFSYKLLEIRRWYK